MTVRLTRQTDRWKFRILSREFPAPLIFRFALDLPPTNDPPAPTPTPTRFDELPLPPCSRFDGSADRSSTNRETPRIDVARVYVYTSVGVEATRLWRERVMVLHGSKTENEDG